MFNLIEKHQTLVKGIMITIVATFVLWGIGGYLGMGADDDYVAKIGSNKIYLRDIDNALAQNPQNPQSNDKMQILFGLINRQLLLNLFTSYHMVATKEQLQQQIAKIPLFLSNAKFDIKKYQEFLISRLMTAEQFQNEVSQQILLNQMLDFFKSTYSTSATFDRQFVKLLSRQRSVASYTIDPQQFYSQVNITDKDITEYYKQNIAKFTLPAQARLQYLVLSAQQVAKNIKPLEAEINKYLANHKLATTEINVSHILFAVPSGANADSRAKIRAKAEEILALVTLNPTKFTSLAKKYSEDPLSAKKGGDLGYFGKGVMVGPFEKAAFSMKPGQISRLVETPYGYHILKRGGSKEIDSATLRIAAIAALQKQQATTALHKQLELLNDITYNQPSSLEPAAKKLGLALLDHDWVQKGIASGEFADPKIQHAIFTNDVINKHNNSEVVALDNERYAVYRIVEYRESQVEPLEKVREQIALQLKLKQASQLAYQEGQKEITGLQSGKLQLNFTETQDVTLLGQSKDINPMAVKQIFSAKLSTLPAYTGSINESGAFVIYKINGENIDPKLNVQNLSILDQFKQNNAMVDFGAYLGYLRTEYAVNYRVEALQQQTGQP